MSNQKPINGSDPSKLDPFEDANHRVFEVLFEQGDALSTVREIDHFSYFPSLAGRARFVDRCVAAGLKLRSLYASEGALETYAVIVYHDDIPDEETLAKLHGMLTAFAEAEGGRYDGWETQIVV
ncbi:MAG: ribonuclease E inhibitor RraB [Proteobacteria bacterium]|nr:ribonuclease E inhibitor RraB [Pseudomonadota bacterium]